ncbi:MAG: 30S ribosomal protein S6 [Candidatus Omnitrophota bacterium]
MKNYEGMFLLSPNLAEENLEKAISVLKDVLQKNEATIEKIENLGKKSLTFKIKKCKESVYILIYFAAKPSAILAIEKMLKLNESVLRIMITVKE